MVVKTAQQIVDDIVAHARKCGGTLSDWYAGIAGDPRDCLFNRHCVDEEKDAWIHREAANETSARSAETALHEAGFDGGPGGGDASTRFVYAYKKSSHTSED